MNSVQLIKKGDTILKKTSTSKSIPLTKDDGSEGTILFPSLVYTVESTKNADPSLLTLTDVPK